MNEDLYRSLEEQLGGEDAIRPQQALMIKDIVRIESLKDVLEEDIKKRGLTVSHYNGRQRVEKDNASIDKLNKLMEQQRRLLVALGLAGKAVAAADHDDGGDDDDDFDAL